MKDYAKPQKSSTKPKRPIRPWTTAIIVLVAIALPIIMVATRFQKTAHHRKEEKVTTQIQIPKGSAKKEKVHKKDDQEFDFYNLLSKSKKQNQ